MNEEIITLAVTEWELRSAPALGAMLITIQYLTNPMQRPEDAEERTFVLHATQARELAERILVQCTTLESGEPQGTGLPKH
jgi:hypothetical protein